MGRLSICIIVLLLSACGPADQENQLEDRQVQQPSAPSWEVELSTDEFDRPIPGAGYARHKTGLQGRLFRSGADAGPLEVYPSITKNGDVLISMWSGWGRRAEDRIGPITDSSYAVSVLRTNGTKGFYLAHSLGRSIVIKGQEPMSSINPLSLTQILVDDIDDDVQFHISRTRGVGGSSEIYRFSVSPEQRRGLREALVSIGAVVSE